MNLAQLPRQEIENFGEHVSIIFEGREWTNVEMNQASNRLAGALKELGIGKSDRVIIQMPNCPEVLQSFIAVYTLGAVVVPINFMVGEAETAYIYQDTGATTIISSREYLPKIEACRKDAPEIRNIILIDEDNPPGTLSFQEILKERPDTIEIEDTDEDDLAALIYTAGTTGQPKGVMHTHGSLLSNAKMQKDTLGFPSGMTSIGVLPLCHSYGIASMNLSMVLGGGRTVVLNSFDIDKVFQSIDTYRANLIGAVPTMYIFMLLHPDPGKYDFSSMKYWISGSAP